MVMLGQNCGTPCDPCCACGLFCSNTDYCGRSMEFVLTHSGSANGGITCTNCATMDTAVSTMQDGINNYTFSSDVWNSTWKYPGAAFDAKDGTNVCFWSEPYPATGLNGTCYSGVFVTGIVVAVYFGTDDKWHMTYCGYYVESSGVGTGYSSTVSGDAEFAGGGAAMDCGAVGEGTPTFSLTIALAEYDAVGGPQECVPPTSVLVEGNPQ